jgi:anthranilate phosphoribosyltransferase
LAATSVDDIKVSSLKEAVNKLLDVLAGKHSAARNIVVLNAGAAIYAAGITDTIKEGIEAAIESIDSHAAMTKLTDLKKLSNNHAK